MDKWEELKNTLLAAVETSVDTEKEKIRQQLDSERVPKTLTELKSRVLPMIEKLDFWNDQCGFDPRVKLFDSEAALIPFVESDEEINLPKKTHASLLDDEEDDPNSESDPLL
eukprot:TRINITY_DN133031_c2_g1_i1.p1 TRINITY_DN133031_c2_g1~~TRINITY_DN133031_c2_g1_i1.p1  ORF type:complete len:123 (-),score=1.02 TRINITY_DN133031_c2_g1_i1:55-390(-)